MSGNVNLINEISDHYADYKTEKTTKGQYDARRKKILNQLKENIEPMKEESAVRQKYAP